MKKPARRHTSVAAYHAAFPPPVRTRLDELRAAIERGAPSARGEISYNMPAYRQHRILVYYAAFTNHVTFFAFPAAMAAFRDEIARFSRSKGGIRFPLDRRIPGGLIARMARFRAKADAERAATNPPRPRKKRS